VADVLEVGGGTASRVAVGLGPGEDVGGGLLLVSSKLREQKRYGSLWSYPLGKPDRPC
jgi:hypothetical protein